MGKRIKAYEMIDKEYNDITPKEFRELSEKVRLIAQQELTEQKNKYGKRPYKFGELIKVLLKNIKQFPWFFFMTWCLTMNEFDWQYNKNKNKPFKFNKNIFRIISILFKRPITIAFFIPVLGWVPIFIKSFLDRKKKK